MRLAILSRVQHKIEAPICENLTEPPFDGRAKPVGTFHEGMSIGGQVSAVSMHATGLQHRQKTAMILASYGRQADNKSACLVTRALRPLSR
jgi:hypothetical protein